LQSQEEWESALNELERFKCELDNLNEGTK
jgi:hypothetical protein